jgi:hypothetical protein
MHLKGLQQKGRRVKKREIKAESLLDKILKYKTIWLQHIDRKLLQNRKPRG